MRDYFEDYKRQPEDLKVICEKWETIHINEGLGYEGCANFLKEVEAIGYTFSYGLDGEPYGLVPILKFARKCDVTGKGFNVGFCFGDGLFYCKSEVDAIETIKNDLKKGNIAFKVAKDGRILDMYAQSYMNFSDSEVLSASYEANYHYYSDWSETIEDEDNYFDAEGNEFESLEY